MHEGRRVQILPRSPRHDPLNKEEEEEGDYDDDTRSESSDFVGPPEELVDPGDIRRAVVDWSQIRPPSRVRKDLSRVKLVQSSHGRFPSNQTRT